MRKACFAFFTSIVVLAGTAVAQTNGPLPKTLAGAKTVAIVNDTHSDAVAQGAVDALRAWGRFTVVDDPDNADITLRFDKTRGREGRDTQKPATETGGESSYSYSMSFSSSIHMKAYLKDGDAPFYTTKTDDAKKKAGMACVSDFRTALQAPR